MEFPYWSNTLPPFASMFRELVNDRLAGDSAEGCAKVLQRKYPVHHRRVDGISNHFTESVRIHGCISGFPPPIETWKSMHASSFAGKTSEDLREMVYSAGRECNLFNPAFARLLYESYGARGGTVFDLSAGWGDRAIAAGAVGALSYFGYDPNHALLPCYEALAKAVNDEQRKLGMTVTKYVFTADLEEAKGFPANEADVVLLSPPYFDLEVYVPRGSPEAAGQSIEMYSKYEDWHTHFLVPYLQWAASAVAPGGALIVYIENVRCRNGADIRPLATDTAKLLSSIPALKRGSDFGLQVESSGPGDMRGRALGASWRAEGAAEAAADWNTVHWGRAKGGMKKPRVRKAMVWLRLPACETLITTIESGSRFVSRPAQGCNVYQYTGARGQKLHIIQPSPWGFSAWGGIEFPKGVPGIVYSVLCTEDDIASAACHAAALGLRCEIVLCSIDHEGNRRKNAEIHAFPWVIAAIGFGANVTIAADWQKMCAVARKLSRGKMVWVPETFDGPSAAVAAQLFKAHALPDSEAVGLRPAIGSAMPDAAAAAASQKATAQGEMATIWTTAAPKLIKVITTCYANPVRIVPASRKEKVRERMTHAMSEMEVPPEQLSVSLSMESAVDELMFQLEGEDAADPAAVPPPPAAVNRYKNAALWREAAVKAKDGDIILLTGCAAPLL